MCDTLGISNSEMTCMEIVSTHLGKGHNPSRPVDWKKHFTIVGTKISFLSEYSTAVNEVIGRAVSRRSTLSI